MKYYIILILLILQINISKQTIKVLNLPEELEEEFEDPIYYSIGNFGLIPYGSVGRAPLRKANPLKACEELIDDDTYEKILPFVLIERGDCHFTQKVLNAQKSGAKLAIIMDNAIEKTQYITMGDDGQGDEIVIPSILISEEDGEKLMDLINIKDYLEENHKEEIELEIDFKMPLKNKPEVIIYIDPPKRNNYHLLFNFQNNFQLVESHIDLKIAYQLFQVPEAEYLESPSDNCIQNGLFCALDKDGDKPGTGAEVAEEYLYQICVHKIYGDSTWFQYVRLQYELCYQIPNYVFCREQLNFQLDLDQQKIENCMDNDKDEGQFSISEQQLEYYSKNDLTRYPIVYINGVLYRGSYDGTDVIEAVCAATTFPSQQCQYLIDKSIRRFEREPDSESESSESDESSSQSNEQQSDESSESEQTEETNNNNQSQENSNSEQSESSNSEQSESSNDEQSEESNDQQREQSNKEQSESLNNEQSESSNEQSESSNEQSEQSNEQSEQSKEQSEQSNEQSESSNEQSEQSEEQEELQSENTDDNSVNQSDDEDTEEEEQKVTRRGHGGQLIDKFKEKWGKNGGH